ncbi:hypothetical protein FXV91_10675 [Methanosarcina sp. DH2]|nr:hypothetical protein [Methanosarcina sp. DH2]
MPEIPVPADYPIKQNYRPCKVLLLNRQNHMTYFTFLNTHIREKIREKIQADRRHETYISTELKVNGFSLQDAPIYMPFNAWRKIIFTMSYGCYPPWIAQERQSSRFKSEFCPSSKNQLTLLLNLVLNL